MKKILLIALLGFASFAYADIISDLGCGVGLTKGCIKAAKEYENKYEYKKAAELYKKACDGGDADGCYAFGKSYEYGKGAIQNFSKAAEFYEKACDGGDIMDCSHYNELKSQGY
ncbi:tetratricopeptide repeat protein [Campylobacter geochelonis]|uniref:tetratricopeptide repeat protein n=1 Tax=Campylobacter geochelonis TaxID=1780362 RepID=UPI0007709000|nr:sel1 repeat family protein [Campylobacter geochelonis]CZE50912.1 beta-lactamase HcpA [Campylobacter geochelonis]